MNIDSVKTGMNVVLNGRHPATVLEVNKRYISSWGFRESAPVKISVTLSDLDGPQVIWVDEALLSTPKEV